MSIAHTILQQLGGHKFVVMTGARHLVACENALQFRLPSNFAKAGINAVRVTLEENDTYRVDFNRVRGISCKPVATHEGIYCDMLQQIFTAETGLDTHF